MENATNNRMIENLASAMRQKGWKALAVALPSGALELALEETDSLPELSVDGVDYTSGDRKSVV